MKNLLIAFTLLSTAFAFADESGDKQAQEIGTSMSEVLQVKQVQDRRLDESPHITNATAHDSSPPQEPPKQIVEAKKKGDKGHHWHFYVHGELLRWVVQEGSLDYAIKQDAGIPPPAVSGPIGKFKTAQFNRETGWRFSAGFRMNPEVWEILYQRTYMKSHGHDFVERNPDPRFFLWGTFIEGVDAGIRSAESTIHLHYSTDDLLFLRYFSPSKYVTLGMVGGGTHAHLDQDWKVQYVDRDTPTTIANWRHQWKFSGLGFRAGVGMLWELLYGFRIISEFNAAAVHGSYKNQTSLLSNNSAFGPDNPDFVVNSVYRDHRIAYHTRFLVGPSWAKTIDAGGVQVFFGYELNTWFNLHEVYRVTMLTSSFFEKPTIINRGVISMSGITAFIKLSF